MWFSVALMKFHWFGINWHVFNQSECRNCCLYIVIQKIAPQAKSGKYFQIWFFPRFGGKNGGVLSMRMQVILDSSFARPSSVPIWGGKKGEFRDWTKGASIQSTARYHNTLRTQVVHCSCRVWMTYNFSSCFYMLFQSFRAQSIVGKCTSRHCFPYGRLQKDIIGYLTYRWPRADYVI